MHKIYESSMMNKSKRKIKNDLQSILKTLIILITITNVYNAQKKTNSLCLKKNNQLKNHIKEEKSAKHNQSADNTSKIYL